MLRLAFSILLIFDLTAPVTLYATVKIVILTEGADPPSVWKTEIGIVLPLALRHFLILFVARIAGAALAPDLRLLFNCHINGLILTALFAMFPPIGNGQLQLIWAFRQWLSCFFIFHIFFSTQTWSFRLT
jgi:hypothetical protein